jgi:outer membrane receptor protein involved in Fe transport
MFGKISTRVCEIDWRSRLLTSAAVVALSTTTFAASAWADDPPPPPPEESSAPPPAEEVGAPPMAVEKVVVTATRRETALVKTPVAVTAVSGKALEAAEVENIEDLMALVPSLVVTNNGHPFAFTTRIRGVGTQGDNPGLEAAVGTFVDGVYRNRPGVAMSDLGDMERIEVLRGPQGTLFGRNTSAGIINVITKKPTWDNQIWGEVTGGSYDLLAARGGFNAVIAPDALAARFNFVRQEREGYIDVNPGRPDSYDGNATSFWGGKGQLLWQPNQDVNVRLIGDYSERKDQCCSAVTVVNGLRTGAAANFGFGRTPTVAFPDTSAPAIINSIEAPFPGKSTTNQVDNLIAFGNSSTDSKTKDKGVSGELNWRFGGVKLTSITSYREWENAYGQDADFSGADILSFPDDGTNFNKFETITHETRLNGETGWVNWLVGVFYSNEDITRQQRLRFGADAEAFLSLHRVPGDSPLALRSALGAFGQPIGTPVFAAVAGDNDNYEQNAESFAAFTHNVFHLTDDLDFIAGVRWTTETKEFRATYRTIGQTGCSNIETAGGGLNLGLDPNAGAALLADSTRRLIALACLPFARSALDVLTAAAPHLQERTEDEFSGIATLAYQFNSNLNTYATYSRGHKAGGFNLDRAFNDALGSIVSPATLPGPQTVRAPDTSFDSELVDAYELGLKLASDDNTFQMNVAGFYQDFENFQLNTFTGVSFIVTSVPEVISKGVEVETFWAPFRDFSTNLGVAYTDARYGDNLGAFVAQNHALFALPGERLTHSPEWTVTGGWDYSFPFIDTLTARLHMDGRWQSEMDTGSNLDARKIQDAYAVFGAKIGFYSEDEVFGLEFFARNLFDERYINTAFDSPLQGTAQCSSTLEPVFCPVVAGPITASQSSTIDAFVGEPRMIGATLRIKN